VALVESDPVFPNIHETMAFLAVQDVHTVRRLTRYPVCTLYDSPPCDNVGTDSVLFGSTWSTKVALIKNCCAS